MSNFISGYIFYRYIYLIEVQLYGINDNSGGERGD